MITNTQRRYWRISPGERGFLWREQKLHNCIALGWSSVGDISKSTKNQVRARFRGRDWSKQGADVLYKFATEVGVGDRVVVSASARGVFALATVIGGYKYDKQLTYSHTFPVRWDMTFWHPVEIPRLRLRGDLLNKFHGRSSGMLRDLGESEWKKINEMLTNIPTPFRNLSTWGGLVQSPEYENEVIILFSQMLQHLRMRIVGFGTRFPDAIVERKGDDGKWRRLNIEFELHSSGFQCHLLRAKKVDCHTIICWEDDWDHPRRRQFDIIELKAHLEQLL